MKQRHLAIFLPSLDGGGAERVMLTLAEYFVARGVQCDLVIAMNQGRLLGRVPPGVRLITLGKRKTLHAVFALARYLRHERPHSVLGTVFTANLTMLFAALFAPRSIRVIPREANQTEQDLGSGSFLQVRLNKLIAPLLYRRADAVIAVATSIVDGLATTRVASRSKVHVIRNPVLPSPATSTAQLTRDPLLVLACGRLELQKDHATLLRAFAKVVEQRQARLVILGEGSEQANLQTLTEHLGLGTEVTLAGFSDAPQEWMRMATVLAHPSRFEGMSNVLIEAMANGCAIVATDCPGGSREVLDGGKYGSLVPVGDADAIARAIVQLLDGEISFPDNREHLEKFALDAVAEAYLSVLFPKA